MGDLRNQLGQLKTAPILHCKVVDSIASMAFFRCRLEVRRDTGESIVDRFSKTHCNRGAIGNGRSLAYLGSMFSIKLEFELALGDFVIPLILHGLSEKEGVYCCDIP